MATLRDMFPSKYLQSEDLPRGRNTTVTIERVYPGAATAARDGDEPTVKWMIRFREFRKPMTLWESNARLIAEICGSEDYETWRGKQVNIYPSTYTSFGQVKPCINVDKFPPEASLPPPGPAGSALVITHDTRPIPREAMARFLGHLQAAGKTWDDFLRWCKLNAFEALSIAFGVELDAIPAGILPAMKAYLDVIAAPPAAPAKNVVGQLLEIIDKRTGEVTPVTNAAAAAVPERGPGLELHTSGRAATAGVPLDDIPF